MAERINKFKERYAKRNETSTDETIKQLLENEEKKEIRKIPEINKEVTKKELVSEEKEIQKTKRKVGRPKKSNEERVLFNFRISESEKEILNLVSTARGKSMSDYLIDLMKKDYENNIDYYDSVRKNLG